MEHKIEENDVVEQKDVNNMVNNENDCPILIVEDEDSERTTLKVALEAEHFDVDVACDGAETELMVKKKFYDVIIIDYRLPDTEGTSLINVIKKISPDSVPIIVTAYSSVEVAINSLKNGAYDYMVKPINIPNLLKVIHKIREDVKNLLKSKKNLRDIVVNNSVNYLIDKDVVVITTPNTNILSNDSKKFNLLKCFLSFFRVIKNYYWG